MHLTSQLKRAVERNFPKIDIVFAYGSAVFHQRNHDPNDSMIDFIFAVQDPLSWHKENRLRNPHHYSFLKYLGAEIITNVQCRYGAGVYYNTLVDLQLRSGKSDAISGSIAIKYGVVSCSDLCQDLEHWTRLYISGRMHKPVLMINCDYDPFDRAHRRNLTNALHYALICLPYKFSERELFLKIAGISYSGDFRMTFGENPKKVQNIVDGNYSEMVSLYTDTIKNCRFIQRSNHETHMFYSSKEDDTLQLVESLPYNVHVHMRHRNTSKYTTLYGKQEIHRCVQAAVKDIVRSSSRSQSIKGMFTAGAWKSALPHAHKKLLPSETLTNDVRTLTELPATCPIRIYPPSKDLHQWWQNSEYSTGALASIMTVRDSTPIIGFICSVLPKTKAEALQRRERVCRLVNRLIGALVFVPCEEEQCVPSAAAVDLVYDSQRKCIFLIGSILMSEILEREPLEDLKMHLLMYTSCNALFHVQDSQRFDIAMLRQFEALAESKKLLANALQQDSMKRSKRDKNSGKHAKASQNIFAPGYCVPFSVFVLPGSKDKLHASPSPASSYCRKMDNLLFSASKVLCPGVIGISRMREISAASMEGGLFHLDPAYSVALVSDGLTTWKGELEHNCDKVLNALDEDLIDGSESNVDVESLLQLFAEDDGGIVHLSHIIDRFVGSMHGNRDSYRRFHAKDKNDGDFSELFSPKQWLAMYQHLYFAIEQITEKKSTLHPSNSQGHGSCSSDSSSPLSK